MANQYNRFQDTDYVHMPIEAYQMALGSAEEERMQQLATDKQQYDALNAVQASFNPDEEVKKDALAKLTANISDLSGRNLRASDTLLNLGRVVNDPTIVDSLANVQANTVLKKTRQDAIDAYAKENGNDINTVRLTDQEAAYNKLGKAGFKPNFLAGQLPGKFIDIEDKVRKTFDGVKDSGYHQDTTTGRWILHDGEEGMSLPDLLMKANPELKDAKYASQIKEYAYHEMRKWGDPSDPGTAIQNYNGAHASHLSNLIDEATTHLNDFIAQSHAVLPKNKRAYIASNIEKTQKLISSYQDQLNTYTQDSNGSALTNDVMENLALGAVSPLVHGTTTHTISVDPYGLEQQTSNNALRNSMLLRDKITADAKDLFKFKEQYGADKTKEQLVYDTNPTLITASMPIAGNLTQVPTFAMDKLGGYSSEDMAGTVTRIVSGIPSLSEDVTGKDINMGMLGAANKNGIGIKGKDLATGVKQGIYQVSYVPKTERLMISGMDQSSGKGFQVRIPAPLNIVSRMKPLTDFYNPKPGADGVATVDGLSLDGQTTTRMYVVPKPKNTAGPIGELTLDRLKVLADKGFAGLAAADGAADPNQDTPNVYKDHMDQMQDPKTKQPAFYPDGTPMMAATESFPMTAANEQVFKAWTGKADPKDGLSFGAVKDKPDGIYAMFKGNVQEWHRGNVTTGDPGSFSDSNRTYALSDNEEYERERTDEQSRTIKDASGRIEYDPITHEPIKVDSDVRLSKEGSRVVYVYKRGNTLQIIDRHDDTDGNQQVLSGTLKRETHMNGAWSNITSPRMDKTRKTDVINDDDGTDTPIPAPTGNNVFDYLNNNQ